MAPSEWRPAGWAARARWPNRFIAGPSRHRTTARPPGRGRRRADRRGRHARRRRRADRRRPVRPCRPGAAAGAPDPGGRRTCRRRGPHPHRPGAGPGTAGPGRLHAHRVADLTMYVRQSHAERDLAALAWTGGSGHMSNCHRFAAVPLAGGGTSVRDWLAADRLPALDLADCPGLIDRGARIPTTRPSAWAPRRLQLAAAGVDVQMVAVSDGGGAHPDLSPSERTGWNAPDGPSYPRPQRFSAYHRRSAWVCPTAQLADHEERAGRPARRDPRGRARRHLVCGHLARRRPSRPRGGRPGRRRGRAAHRCAPVVEYPIWMWHWARPGDPAVPWDRAVLGAADPVGRGTQTACGAVLSQPVRVHDDRDPPPMLPPFVLRRLLAVGEVVFR